MDKQFVDQDAPPRMLWIPVLIPPGQYEAAVIKRLVQNVRRFNKKMLYLWFEIWPPNQYAGSQIFRSLHYGNLSPTGAYAREWMIANGGKRPTRWDQMSPKIFDGKVFSITVRNVKSGLNSVVHSIDALNSGGNNARN